MTGNVLLIVVDQLRADLLHGGLAAVAPTPNLDAFSTGAAAFRRHHTVAMPCSPSRASLLTGQYVMNHRVTDNGAPLARRHANLATEVRKLGLEPLLFGYTDTQPDPAGMAALDPARRTYTAAMPGFVEVVEMREEAWRWLGHLRAKGYDVPDSGADDAARLYRPVDGRLGGPALYRAEDSDTAFLTDETLRALDVRKGRPWFAMLSYIRPHPPFVAPAPYNDLVAPGDIPPPIAGRPDHAFVDAYFSGPSAVKMFWGFDGDHDRLDAETTALLRAAYIGLVAEVDAHIGRVLDWLAASGQADDTLVVITSDHGELLGDHGMWGKRAPFNGATHVPLLLRDPRAGEGRVIERLTESVDVAPTILDWLGAEPPASMNGRSLLPYLTDGAAPPGRQAAFAEFELGDPVAPTRYQTAWDLPADRCRAAVMVSDDWRYGHFAGGVPPMLFNLADDPDEATDLARDPAAAAVVSDLRAEMLTWRMENAAPPLLP